MKLTSTGLHREARHVRGGQDPHEVRQQAQGRGGPGSPRRNVQIEQKLKRDDG